MENEKIKKTGRILSVVFVMSVVLVIVGVIASGTFKSDAVVVDFDDVIPDAGAKNIASKDTRPILRIAIAAMISPKTTAKYYDKLLEFIGDRMGCRMVFTQRKTYEEVNQLLKDRKLDLAFVCAGPYVTGHKNFGMELLVVPVAHGEKVYYSYLLAGKDSKIKSLDDLGGKKFVFTDPHSNTGCLVPKYMLARKGHSPESFFGEFFFSNSHDNSIKAVAEDLADGAAVDSLIWEFANTVDPTYTSKTTIIEKSPPYGIPPVVVHPDIDPQLKEQFREVFLHLHEDTQAAELLNKLQIDKFEMGDDAAYDSVRDMINWLEENEKD